MRSEYSSGTHKEIVRVERSWYFYPLKVAHAPELSGAVKNWIPGEYAEDDGSETFPPSPPRARGFAQEGRPEDDEARRMLF